MATKRELEGARARRGRGRTTEEGRRQYSVKDRKRRQEELEAKRRTARTTATKNGAQVTDGNGRRRYFGMASKDAKKLDARQMKAATKAPVLQMAGGAGKAVSAARETLRENSRRAQMPGWQRQANQLPDLRRQLAAGEGNRAGLLQRQAAALAAQRQIQAAQADPRSTFYTGSQPAPRNRWEQMIDRGNALEAEANEGASPAERAANWLWNNSIQELPTAAASMIPVAGQAAWVPRVARAVQGLAVAGKGVSSAGLALDEAQRAGASNGRAWRDAAAAGGLNAVSETLPIKNMTNLLSGAERSAGRAIGSALGAKVGEEGINTVGGAAYDRLAELADQRAAVEEAVGQEIPWQWMNQWRRMR